MTANPNDPTIEGRLDQIADNLETRARIDPGAARKDRTTPAILQRINNAISGGAFEAHLIDDHTDAAASGPDDGDFFRYSATLSAWLASKMVLSDATDVIATPTSGKYLRGNGAIWTESSLLLVDLPIIGLNDLSDVILNGSEVVNDILVHDGINFKNQLLSPHQLNTTSRSGDPIGTKTCIVNTVTGIYYYKWAETLFLFDSLDDTNIGVQTAGDGLKWDGADWINTPLVIELLLDTDAATPSDDDILQFSTGTSKWEAIQLLLNTLGDIDVASPTNLDLFQYQSGSGNWENITIATALDGTYVRRDGTVAMTADWSTTGFDITAKGLRASITTPDVTDTAGIFTINVADSVDAAAAVHTGLDVDIDYNFDNPAGLDVNIVRGLNIDLNVTTTNTAFSGLKVQGLKCILTNDADTVFGTSVPDNPYYFKVDNQKTDQSFAEGAFRVDLDAGTDSAQLVASKFTTTFGGTGQAYAYQGFVSASPGATGIMTVIEAYARSQVGITSLIGVSSKPSFLGTPPAFDKICAYRGDLGNALFSRGSLFVTIASRALPTNITPTHLTPTAVEGAGYFEGMLEVDGVVYADGGVTMAAATMLTIGVYTDGTRGAAGTAGRMIFNTTDGNLNIDDGTNWILPDGTTT